MPVSAIATNAPPGTGGANHRTVATRGDMGDEQEKAGFRVTDRRRFAAEVAASPDEPTRDDPPASADPSLAHEPFEPVSFSTFVLGLSTQALLHLGEMANPESGKVEQDLGGAKHLIDILGILRDKDWPGIARILGPLSRRILLTPVISERSASPMEIESACREANPSAETIVCGSVTEALEKTVEDPFVLVTGSLYLVGEALEHLEGSPGRAFAERSLNEWSART